jgi:hypothetical protein
MLVKLLFPFALSFMNSKSTFVDKLFSQPGLVGQDSLSWRQGKANVRRMDFDDEAQVQIQAAA